MAEHRSKQILDAIQVALTGLVTTGANVEQSRVYPANVSAALTIQRGSDAVLSQNSQFTDRALEVSVSIHIQNRADLLDDVLAQVALETYKAMMASPTFGLSFVIDTDPVGEGEPEVSGEAERPTALLEQRWRIHYRHSRTDPSA